MNQQELTAFLAAFAAQLPAVNSEEEQQLTNLQQALAPILMHQDPATVTNQSFTFLQSDLFQAEHLPEEKLQNLQNLILQAAQDSPESDLRIFMRDVAVRSTQMAGSAPAFAAGARAVNTAGPFRSREGRPILIDFFRVEKSIALYFQGQSLPAILFSARRNIGDILLPNGIRAERTTRYQVVPTSVWINAHLLSPTAPADRYCGLRVKGGTIELSEAPQFTNNQLVMSANTQVQVRLDLEQKEVTDADTSSPYGKDARAAQLRLPQSFAFRFTANATTLQEIAPAAWTVYGQAASFTYNNQQHGVFNPFLNRLTIPLDCDTPQFTVTDCQSSFLFLSGRAAVQASWWALPVAQLDVNNPLEADGNGALLIACADGLQSQWPTTGNQPVSLPHPFILGEPGRIGITDLKSNGSGAFHHMDFWKDEVNAFGTSVDLYFKKEAPLVFNTLSKGDEVLMTQTHAHLEIDRPVKVNGEAVAVRTKDSVLIFSAHEHQNRLALYDENILWDNKLPAERIPSIKSIALALHNALFTVTPPNGALLFGNCNEQFTAVTEGNLFLTFGLFSYLPTLPDPYTTNLGVLRRQFEQRESRFTATGRNSTVWLWLICRIKWQPQPSGKDAVGVSFHFAPLQQALTIEKKALQSTPNTTTLQAPQHPFFAPFNKENSNLAADSSLMVSPELLTTAYTRANTAVQEMPDKIQLLYTLTTDMFTLLDVSSKANQMGVSFSAYGERLRGITRFTVNTDVSGTSASVFPIQVQGMDVVSIGRNVKAFTLPQISWEPIYNFTPPAPTPSPTPEDPAPTNDPPYGWNYFPNDGFATRIGNLSNELVPLSPIPLSKYLVQVYREQKDQKTFALFNLPFGMLALSILDQQSKQTTKAQIQTVQPVFNNYINGGIQLELVAGSSNNLGEDNLFEGFTVQLNNINDTSGNGAYASTLGSSVTTIFNNEFFKPNNFETESRSAVPLTRIGLSGYGASTFSNWMNKEAAFAQTSQALFNVTVGRTNHEVIQVKSMIYPWGIRVVRTITIFRLANGFVGRVDSGWKAESDGKFDFSYNIQAFRQGSGNDPATKRKFPVENPYSFHPGMIRGVYNVRNIREIDTKFTSTFKVSSYTYEYDAAENIIPIPTPDPPDYEQLRGLTFDADVLLEHVTEGGSNDFVPSKGILGFVQLAPRGIPIYRQTFADLLQSQNGTIGGPINCVIKVANTDQRMQLNRFDVNNAVDNTSNPIFVGAARGSVVLPKDGSWSMVMHTRGSGDVTPVPESYSVPLIREGLWQKDSVVNPADVTSKLLRIAHPFDVVRNAADDTINFGFLQNLPTQKVLFLTPAFSTAQKFLLSKTPPLLADSYRLLNSKGIFPNIGKADGADFGTAIQLLKGIDAARNAKDAFTDSGLLDGGKKALQLLEVKAKEEGQKLLDQGYKLIKDKANDLANEAFKFDLPAFEYPLVDITGLKIYVEYKASSDNKKLPNKDYVGKFDFNVDSFAADMAKTWKGRMHNLAMVVDLGPLKRLMTIQGNFNSQKGKATDLGSKDAGDDDAFTLPTPEIKFSDALEPVIKILEILAQLSQGEYGDALKKGLKVAMSNNANIWEYKFDATKDIPLVRFPMGALYDAPQTPLKLEASMALGVYFNAALKVTTDPKQLLPTAGAFFQFHGGLQVMCVSLAAATIYAVGQVDLKLAADTSPNISLTMKFGFGAQIGVGLPVVGTVSVLFMVGVEIYADSNQKVIVTALMLFRGHAELLGGLVGVTITIEAKGSIEKSGASQPTYCQAQVTFALDISIFLVIDISFSESWEEQRQIA